MAIGTFYNIYGIPSWPSDLFYIFLICIIGWLVLSCLLEIKVPTRFDVPAEPFLTPLVLRPEWFMLPFFNLLRFVPNRFLGFSTLATVPLALTLVSASAHL